MNDLPPVGFPGRFLHESEGFGLSRTMSRLGSRDLQVEVPKLLQPKSENPFQAKDASLLLAEFAAIYEKMYPFSEGQRAFFDPKYTLLDSFTEFFELVPMSADVRQRLDSALNGLREARDDSELRLAVQSIERVLVEEGTPELLLVAEVVRRLAQKVFEETFILEELREKLQSGAMSYFPSGQRELKWSERVDPLVFLREHYGKYIDAGRLSQADLRDIDERLFQAVHSRVQYLRRQGEDIELRTVLPPARRVRRVKPL